MTTADIKRQLTEKHGIKWTEKMKMREDEKEKEEDDKELKKEKEEDGKVFDLYVLCRLEEDRVGPELKDYSERVECGSSLMLYCCDQKGKTSFKLPTVLFDLPAESIEIDGVQMIPVKVMPRNSESEPVEQSCTLQLPLGCTALQLKQMLVDVGYHWAVSGLQVLGFSKKVIEDECVIPSNCNCIQVIQKKLPR
jgi:hypothetical protein